MPSCSLARRVGADAALRSAQQPGQPVEQARRHLESRHASRGSAGPADAGSARGVDSAPPRDRRLYFPATRPLRCSSATASASERIPCAPRANRSLSSLERPCRRCPTDEPRERDRGVSGLHRSARVSRDERSSHRARTRLVRAQGQTSPTLRMTPGTASETQPPRFSRNWAPVIEFMTHDTSLMRTAAPRQPDTDSAEKALPVAGPCGMVSRFSAMKMAWLPPERTTMALKTYQDHALRAGPGFSRSAIRRGLGGAGADLRGSREPQHLRRDAMQARQHAGQLRSDQRARHHGRADLVHQRRRPAGQDQERGLKRADALRRHSASPARSPPRPASPPTSCSGEAGRDASCGKAGSVPGCSPDRSASGAVSGTAFGGAFGPARRPVRCPVRAPLRPAREDRPRST